MNKKQEEIVQTETEKKVLGALLIGNSETIDETIEELDLTDFTNTRLRDFFVIICDVWATYKTLDIGKIFQYTQDKKVNLDPDLVMETADSVSDYANVKVHLDWLKEKTYVRNVNKKVVEFQSKLHKSELAGDVDREKEKLITDLSSTTYRNKIVVTNWNKMHEILDKNIREKKQMVGKSTGLTELDALTSGLETGKFYIVGALKKAGKSRFAVHLQKVLHDAGIKTGFLGLEMPEYDTYKLLMAAFTGIPSSFFSMTGKLSEKQKESINDWHHNKINWDLLKLDVAYGVDNYTVKHKLREFYNLGCKYVFVDFLQRVRDDTKKDGNKSDHLTDLSNMIADSGRKLDMGIIGLSQLTNVAEKEVPSVGHLKSSGGIAEAADCIMILDNLYRRLKKESEKGKFDIYVEQRNGDSGRVECKVNLANCHYGDAPFSTPTPPPLFDVVGQNNSNDDPF